MTAYDIGYIAFKEQNHFCPFSESTLEQFMWCHGWLEAASKGEVK